MKTMTIPDYMKPSWECTINGVEYRYPAGATMEVPDEVAVIIQSYYDANATNNNVPAEPALEQPRWGKGADKTVTKEWKDTLGCRWDQFGLSADMTQIEYDGMMKADDFHAVWTHVEMVYSEEVETELEEYHDIEISKEELQYSADYERIWFAGGHGYTYNADYDTVNVSFTYGKTEEVYEHIPKSYYCLPVTLDFTVDTDGAEYFKSDVDGEDIIKAFKSGVLVIATFKQYGEIIKQTAEAGYNQYGGFCIQNHGYSHGKYFYAGN